MRILFSGPQAVVVASVAVILMSVSLVGNLLVLPPVLGVWVFTVMAAKASPDRLVATRHGERSCRGGRGRWILAIVLLVVATLGVGWYRAGSGMEPDGATLTRQMLVAETLFRTGNPHVALEAFRAIEVPEALPKRRAQKHHNIGIISMHLERWDEAETAFREAVRYDPADFDAHYALARLAVRKKAFSEAVGHLSAAVNLEPHHTGAWLLAAQCLTETGEYEQALVAIRPAETSAAPAGQVRQRIADLKKRIEFRASLFD